MGIPLEEHRPERDWTDHIGLIIGIVCCAVLLLIGFGFGRGCSRAPVADVSSPAVKELRAYHADVKLYLDRLDGKRQNAVDQAFFSLESSTTSSTSAATTPRGR